jgi:hypothetical protein
MNEHNRSAGKSLLGSVQFQNIISSKIAPEKASQYALHPSQGGIDPPCRTKISIMDTSTTPELEAEYLKYPQLSNLSKKVHEQELLLKNASKVEHERSEKECTAFFKENERLEQELGELLEKYDLACLS